MASVTVEQPETAQSPPPTAEPKSAQSRTGKGKPPSNTGAASSNRKASAEAKAQARSEITARIKSTPPLPPPPAGTVSGVLYTEVSQEIGRRRALSAWKYWHDNDKEFPDRLTLTIHRLWPHTINKKKPYEAGGNATKYARVSAAEETLYQFPSDYEYLEDFQNLQHFILSRYGSGNYKLTLHDTILNMRVFRVMLNGIWDWEILPRIPWEELDIEHQNNKSFMQGLLNRGIRFPGAPDLAGQQQQVEGDNVATTTVVQQDPAIVGALVEMARDKRGSGDPSDAIEKVNTAWSGVVSGITDTFKEQNRAQQPGTQVKDLIELARTMTPQAPDYTKLIETMQQSQQAMQARYDALMLEHSRERAASVQAEMQALRDQIRHMVTAHHQAATTQTQAVTTPSPTMASQLKEVIELFDGVNKLRDRVTGGGDGGSEEDFPSPKRNPLDAALPAWFGPAMTAAQPVLTLLANVASIWIQKQLAPPGQPIPVQMATNPNPQQTGPQLVPPQPQLNPDPSTLLGGQPPMTFHPAAMLLNTISEPLLTHLNDPQKDGVDFALWFVGGYGQANYQQLAARGVDNVLGLIKEHGPQLWSRVSMAHMNLSGETQPTPQFQQFVEEFCDVEAVRRALRGEDDEENGKDEDISGGDIGGGMVQSSPTPGTPVIVQSQPTPQIVSTPQQTVVSGPTNQPVKTWRRKPLTP